MKKPTENDFYVLLNLHNSLLESYKNQQKQKYEMFDLYKTKKMMVETQDEIIKMHEEREKRNFLERLIYLFTNK